MTIFPYVDRASSRAVLWFSFTSRPGIKLRTDLSVEGRAKRNLKLDREPTYDCVDHRGSKSPDIHVRPTYLGLCVLTMWWSGGRSLGTGERRLLSWLTPALCCTHRPEFVSLEVANKASTTSQAMSLCRASRDSKGENGRQLKQR